VDVLRTLQASFAVLLLYSVAVGIGRPDRYPPALTVFMTVDLAICVGMLEWWMRRHR
jgi:hypothetical protein